MDTLDYIDYIGIAGTIASIVGAYISIKEARKAKKSSQIAEAIRNAISSEQKKINLTKFHLELKEFMAISINLTAPSNTSKKISGVNYDKSIKQLREFNDKLKENMHYFKESNIGNINTLSEKLETLLSDLSIKTDQQSRYLTGNKIHEAMGEILKTLKPEVDLV